MATKITYTQQGDYLLPNLKLPEQDIIDEYDTPIQQGHSCGFYQEVIDYMRNFFSGGLKDNSHLAYGFLSVVLFFSKHGWTNILFNRYIVKDVKKMTEFEKERIIQLRTQGYGYIDIADELNLNSASIRSYCSRNNIHPVTCPQCGI